MLKTCLWSVFLLLLLSFSLVAQESNVENPEVTESSGTNPENIDPEPVQESQNSDATTQQEEPVNDSEEEKTEEISQSAEENQETPNESDSDSSSLGNEETEGPREEEQYFDHQFEGVAINRQRPDYQIPDEGSSSAGSLHGPSDEFIMEWEKVMGEFIPEDITTFKIEGKSAEYFMQEVEVGDTSGAVMIKGAFFIHDDNLKNFRLDSDDLKITVAAHYFHEEKKVVKNKEIEGLQEKLKNSLKTIKSIISEVKFGDTHRTAHLDG